MRWSFLPYLSWPTLAAIAFLLVSLSTEVPKGASVHPLGFRHVLPCSDYTGILSSLRRHDYNLCQYTDSFLCLLACGIQSNQLIIVALNSVRT